jgi:F0F1-type ATP synthase assembly protein I
VPDPKSDQPSSGKPPLSLATLAGLGLANACSLGAGLALGHLADSQLDTSPVFVLVGMASGLVLGAVGSFLEVRRYLQD